MTDTEGMVFDVLAVALLVGAFLYARSLRRSDSAVHLPPDDLPPLEAFAPMPPAGRFRRYVGEGLVELDRFLASRDQAA